MESRMSKPLSVAFVITDSAFLLYWILSALVLFKVIHVPASWMYAGYDEPRVVAWNWSFLPLDLGFSLLGLAAVNASRRGFGVWRSLALLSLAFTIAAGGMAVGYWVILGEFEPSWFFANLLLVIWPMGFLPNLIRKSA